MVARILSEVEPVAIFEGQPKRGYIQIHPKAWFSTRISTKMKQAALYHEFLHYKQWQSGKWDEEIFRLGNPSRFTDEQMRQYVQIEFEASLAESKFAVKNGWTNQSMIYKAYVKHDEEGVIDMVCLALSIYTGLSIEKLRGILEDQK